MKGLLLSFVSPQKGEKMKQHSSFTKIFSPALSTFYNSRLNKENWPYLTGHKNAMQTAVLIPPKWPLKGTLKSPPLLLFSPFFFSYFQQQWSSLLSVFFSISTEKQDGNLIYEEQTEANVVVSSCHTISSPVPNQMVWGKLQKWISLSQHWNSLTVLSQKCEAFFRLIVQSAN